jgi:transposase
MATTHSHSTVGDSRLYVALELGETSWTVALTSGFGQAVWVRTIAARDLRALERLVAAARAAFGLGAPGRVECCYEAGRDGFWVHRAVTALGLHNRVVDSSSIAVDRRARRTKTDRVDARKLLMMLLRVCAGESHVWREVRVPTAAAEAARHRSRERGTLVAEHTRLCNQIGSWLATYGCVVAGRGQQAAQWWTAVRDWQGALLPADVQARLARTVARRAVVVAQIAELDALQQAAVADAPPATPLSRLTQLRGVATTSASILLDEGLVWRGFRNRREVGGYLGFAPAPYQSGTSLHDQGITRAGNARLQAVSLQLAWNWVRWQPQSALTQWYRARFGEGRRARRIGIVALARKLLIALWRYATTGVPPAGACLKPLAA